MSSFEGNNEDNTAIAGELLDGFDGSVPETIDGNNDLYEGLGGDDFVQAGNTNDTLLGGTGLDTLFGGEGNDRIDGGADADFLRGDGGDDIFFITGGEDIDEIDGGMGFDTLDLVAASGNGAIVNLADNFYDLGAQSGPSRSIFSVEAVLGTVNGDIVSGSSASETLSGLGGSDFMSGGGGNDTLNGGAGVDALNGGDGDDVMTGGAGNDSLSGGDDDDRFAMEQSNFIDDVDGGAGTDTLDLSGITTRGAIVNMNFNYRLDDDFGGVREMSGIERVIGTQDRDEIFGTSGADTIFGEGGDDRMNGGTGHDELFGGNGNDTFVMNEGAFIDDVDGNSGNDTLDLSTIVSRGAVIDLAAETWDLSPSFGGPAEIDNIDVIIGTQNNDRISSGFGVQNLRGEGGRDTFIMLEGKFIDDVDGGSGVDTLDLRNITSAGAVINLATGEWQGLGGTRDIASIESIIGTAAGDNVIGGAAGETLNGGDGNDFLNGGFGNDVLTGGRGADILVGGPGLDRFDFNSVADSGTTAATRDQVSGFVHLQEKLDFSGIDARAAPAGDQAFTFIGSAAFTGEGQIRAVQAGVHTVLEINTSGATGAEMGLTLLNFTASTLTGVDFIL
jgi:serralysin